MHLLNVEFTWNPGGLSEVYPVEGPSEPITTAMVRKAINKMSLGKAVGPSGIVAEMLKTAEISLKTSSSRTVYRLSGRKVT